MLPLDRSLLITDINYSSLNQQPLATRTISLFLCHGAKEKHTRLVSYGRRSISKKGNGINAMERVWKIWKTMFSSVIVGMFQKNTQILNPCFISGWGRWWIPKKRQWQRMLLGRIFLKNRNHHWTTNQIYWLNDFEFRALTKMFPADFSPCWCINEVWVKSNSWKQYKFGSMFGFGCYPHNSIFEIPVEAVPQFLWNFEVFSGKHRPSSAFGYSFIDVASKVPEVQTLASKRLFWPVRCFETKIRFSRTLPAPVRWVMFIDMAQGFHAGRRAAGDDRRVF